MLFFWGGGGFVKHNNVSCPTLLRVPGRYWASLRAVCHVSKRDRCLPRNYQWCQNNSVPFHCQASSPSPAARRPPLLGGHVTVSGASRPPPPPPPPYSRMLAPLPHLPAFAAAPLRSCTRSERRGFPGLIKARRALRFRVIERVQHINMFG